jgi:hypothetical protein
LAIRGIPRLQRRTRRKRTSRSSPPRLPGPSRFLPSRLRRIASAVVCREETQQGVPDRRSPGAAETGLEVSARCRLRRTTPLRRVRRRRRRCLRQRLRGTRRLCSHARRTTPLRRVRRRRRRCLRQRLRGTRRLHSHPRRTTPLRRARRRRRRGLRRRLRGTRRCCSHPPERLCHRPKERRCHPPNAAGRISRLVRRTRRRTRRRPRRRCRRRFSRGGRPRRRRLRCRDICRCMDRHRCRDRHLLRLQFRLWLRRFNTCRFRRRTKTKPPPGIPPHGFRRVRRRDAGGSQHTADGDAPGTAFGACRDIHAVRCQRRFDGRAGVANGVAVKQ